MRRLLVILLASAALALVLWVVFSVKESNQLSLEIKPQTPAVPSLVGDISATQLVQEATATSVLKAPRYTGRDEKGRTWEIVAAEAVQSGGAEMTTVQLVSLTVLLEDPSRTLQVELTAPQGDYASVSETIALSGGMEATVTQKGETLWLKAPNAQGGLAMQDAEIRLTGGVTGRVETNK
jgi:hypothetical protein